MPEWEKQSGRWHAEGTSLAATTGTVGANKRTGKPITSSGVTDSADVLQPCLALNQVLVGNAYCWHHGGLQRTIPHARQEKGTAGG